MFRCFDPDGLNQLSTVNGTSAAYDTRGNMTTDPATAKTYSYLKTNNQLATVAAPFTSLAYDALDRLWHVETPTVTNYVSDGTDTIAEYDGSNVLQKRYAFDGTGWPLVQYDAAGNRSWMLPDERGSIVALANDTAAMTAINTYDEYGIPGATNAGTFQYASMLWLSRAGVYAPTFRAYGAHLARFNQTDPIGMAGGINLYAYVGNDPVNRADPLGLACYVVPDPDIGVCGHPTAPLTIAEITPGPDSRKEGTDQRRDGGGDKSQKQKPSPKTKQQQQVEEFCKSALGLILPGLEVGYGTLEGLESAAVITRGAIALGVRGAAAGPLGAVAGAAIGGITAWALAAYGPDVKSLCEK